MKRLLLLLLMLGLTFPTMAQKEAKQTDDAPIEEQIDVHPTFKKGGTLNDFRQWVATKIGYPRYMLEKGIEGTMIASFVIEKDGRVSNIEIVQSVHPMCDKELERILRYSPRWTPGMKDGKPVRVRYHLPLLFRIPAHYRNPEMSNGSYSGNNQKTQPQLDNQNSSNLTHRRSGFGW